MAALILPAVARAYVNHGRWVADCPGADCTDALVLDDGQSAYGCGYCGTVAPVQWPPDPAAIWQALERRPPMRRNWYPHGHRRALRFDLPHGQTPAELDAETAEHMGVK